MNYGSSRHRPEVRAAILHRTVMTLHQTFGQAQCMMQLARRASEAANTSLRHELQIIICTVADRHLLCESKLPSASFEHVVCEVPPLEIGFFCHRVLASHADSAAWFGFVEDDILVTDPLCLSKLDWFIQHAGADCVLQANRFERDSRMIATKAYVDGDLHPNLTTAFQNREVSTEFQLDAFGLTLRMVRPLNPNSSCFFLRQDQLKYWSQQSHCGQPSREFVGPLESAANLSLMRTFRVYKPAIENAGFFEVEHQSNQFISQLRPR